MNLENQKVISLKELKNLETKDLEILGVILVVGNPNQSKVDQQIGYQHNIKIDNLTATQVYQKLKKKDPKSPAALRSFMNRLRNQGLKAIRIGGSFLYKPEDLEQFLNNRKSN